jgi:TatD DNase family protein
VADTHTHLASLEHIDPALALARASLAGLRFVVNVVDPTERARDPRALLADLDRWVAGCAAILDVWAAQGVLDALGERPQVPEVRLLVGCHPHNASSFDEGARAAMRELLAAPITCGIGEIGLDYHYDLSPRDVQRAVFEEQLAWAVELDAPLSLHVREAHADAAPIMRRTGLPAAGAVLHCFDLGPDDAAPFQELGCVLGIGGAATFKRNAPTREAVAQAPAGGVVTETDAPYMAPEPLRGTLCEPAYTALTMRLVADLRAEAAGEDLALAYARAWETARRIFDRPAPLGA